MSLSAPEKHIADGILASRQVRWSLSAFHVVGVCQAHLHTTHRMDRPGLVRQAFALEGERPGVCRVAITEHVTETLRWPVALAALPDNSRSVNAGVDAAESTEYFQVPAYGAARLETSDEVRAVITEMRDHHGQEHADAWDPAAVLILRCVTNTQHRETTLDTLPAG